MVKELPLPKYHQVYLVLLQQIQEGRFDSRLPGELQLARQFNVARVTIRRALERLSDEGLVQRRPGRGTRCAGTTPTGFAAPAETMPALLAGLVNMGLRTQAHVLSCRTVVPTQSVAQALQLGERDTVQKAVRVRHTSAGPMSLITTWVPSRIAASFGAHELARKPILLLLQESGVKFSKASQSLSARLADADVAQHLDVSVGSALIEVWRLILDQHERPVQWLHGVYRPDRYQYEMQVSGVADLDTRIWVREDLPAQYPREPAGSTPSVVRRPPRVVQDAIPAR